MNKKNSNDCRISVSDSAKKQITFLMKNSTSQNVFLRISVSSGGCSGFQYHFDFDNQLNKDDLTLILDDIVFVAIDQTSHELVKGSQIDFIDELGGSFFKLTNPKASSTCGCGSSFAI